MNVSTDICCIDNENKTEVSETKGKVETSFKTFDLNALQESIMQFPDVRGEKVTDIKTHIDNGTYQIFYEEIAERLIEDAYVSRVSS